MTAKTHDYDEIVRVNQLYLDGGLQKVNDAFDEDAWIFFINDDGPLVKGLISEHFEHWPAWNVESRIVSVTQMGDAHGVVLQHRRSTPSFQQLEKDKVNANLVCLGGVAQG